MGHYLYRWELGELLDDIGGRGEQEQSYIHLTPDRQVGGLPLTE